MIERKDVEKLAALARITIPEAEIEKVRKDIGSILDYVSQLNEAGTASGKNGIEIPADQNYDSGVTNVMREDGEPHETGKFTDVLLKCAPKTQNGYIKVKKILQ